MTIPIRKKLIDPSNELGKPSRRGEYHFLFRNKMNFDFGLTELRDLRLPCGEIGVRNRRRAVDPHAQRQSVLVLAGERNETFIAQHKFG